MRRYFGLGLGIIVGAVIGAAAVSGLHAQTKPPLFLITEIDVTNPEAYGKEFAPKAQATIKAAGARFLLIGGTAGAGAKPITAISGTPPKRVTVQVWDSLEAMNKWYNGADYQAALKIGVLTPRRLARSIKSPIVCSPSVGRPSSMSISIDGP